MVGSLIFPTEGCWEIVAQSGNSVLQFVMYADAVYVHGIRRADAAPTPLPTAQPSSSTAAQDCPVTERTIAHTATAVPGGRDPPLAWSVLRECGQAGLGAGLGVDQHAWYAEGALAQTARGAAGATRAAPRRPGTAAADFLRWL